MKKVIFTLLLTSLFACSTPRTIQRTGIPENQVHRKEVYWVPLLTMLMSYGLQRY